MKGQIDKVFRCNLDIAERAKVEYSKETMANRYMKEYDNGGCKRRILLIDINCKNSSTGKIVYDLYQSIRGKGRHAAIAYGRGELVEGDSIFKFGLDWETYLHAALARLTGYNGYFSPISTKRLIKFIDSYAPDIIHIHELHAYFVNIKILIQYIKSKKIPVIWTFHCEYMYTGKCGHAYECTGFRNKCGNCPAVRDYPKSLFFDKTRQMLQMKKDLLTDWDFKIVVPSKWLADRVKKSFLNNKQIKVIHNGIDTEVFKPSDTRELRQKLGIPKECKVVLAVAPDIMSERKGGRWVVKLAEMMDNKKVYFVLVGGDVSCKIFDNIIFVRKIADQRKLSLYYSMADVFVLFSKRETYSMTCAEALCCGTPVIGFRCGAPETVFDISEAIFVDYGDIEKVRLLLRRYFQI